MIIPRRALLGLGLAALAGTAFYYKREGDEDMDSSAPEPVKKTAGLQYILINSTGDTLKGSDGQVRRHPASLTKVMTLYCVASAMAREDTDFNLGSPVKIPELIKIIGKGIAVFENLKPGQVYPAQKILIGAGSRSDAYCTLALALHLGSSTVYDWSGSESEKLDRFIQLMNDTAKEIGMNDSRFSVCTGLPAKNHYSTPRDIAILMQRIHKDFPNFSEIAMGQPDFDIRPLSNARTHTSKILRGDKDVLFAKTGWTNDAGRCLAVVAKAGGELVTAVVLGADSDNHRNNVVKSLLADARNPSKAFASGPTP